MQQARAIQADAADQVFAALGDATRRAIVRLVTQGPQTVSSLATALGVTLTAISQHLRVLQTCGLLRTRKVGRVRMCELDSRGLDLVAQWVAFNRQMWEQRFDALGRVKPIASSQRICKAAMAMATPYCLWQTLSINHELWTNKTFDIGPPGRRPGPTTRCGRPAPPPRSREGCRWSRRRCRTRARPPSSSAVTTRRTSTRWTSSSIASRRPFPRPTSKPH